MAIDVMTLVWKNAPVKGRVLLTLLALADWAREDGNCFAYVGALCDKTRQSERNCQYTLRDLEEQKLIIPVDSDHAARALSYRVNVELLAENGPILVRGAKVAPTKGAKTSKTGVQKPTGKTAVFAPNTEITTYRSKNIYDERFEKFFAEYARPVAKRAACKAWTSALKRLVEGEFRQEKLSEERAVNCLKIAAERFTRQVVREGREDKHIPHPATWLNGACYLDMFAKTTTRSVSSESQSSAPTLLDKVRAQIAGAK